MRLATHVFAGLVLTTLGLSASSCADQGEGQRCDRRNGSIDCEVGLVCTRVSELVRVPGETEQTRDNDDLGLCCPLDTNANTVEACIKGTKFTPPGDGGGVRDSGAVPDAPAEATVSTDTGTPETGASEASLEASVDGG